MMMVSISRKEMKDKKAVIFRGNVYLLVTFFRFRNTSQQSQTRLIMIKSYTEICFEAGE